ncbi:MAG: sodium-dependent bicarbonate transport family permease, partial [Hyphomonadaceae bacterium]|nr:sodium-dependent bicarbonate transport family permease [Hyphomonadaceae bacterium]
DILIQNLVSPITLAFALGMIAALIKSDLEIPDQVLKIMAIFLLMSIGLQGGRELAGTQFSEVAAALGVTAVLVIVLPASAFLAARHLGRFDVANATGVAALYGSVSSVTFLAAMAFADEMGTPAEGFLAALIALMEWGILVALFIGRFALARVKKAEGQAVTGGLGAIVLETVRGRGLVLLVGGMIMGMAIGEKNFERIEPFFVDMFRGVLVLFLLEMGMTAARQLKGFARVGVFMTGFGMVVPLVFGLFGTLLGTLAGLSPGGAFVLGAVAASASYIDAPAAVRAAMPDANPSIYLTSSLAITFPFNLIVGLPLYYQMSLMWQGIL